MVERPQVMRWLCLAFCATFLFCAGLNSFLSDFTIWPWSSLGAAALCGLAVGFACSKGWQHLAGHTLVTGVSFQCFGEIVRSGGLESPVTSLLIVIMPIAILVVGTRSAALWSVIVVAGLLVVAALDIFEMLPVVTETINQRRTIQIATMIACIIGSALTAGYFTRQADQALLALDEERHRHEFRANHDHLTGLPNRAQFERRGKMMLEQASQNGSTCTLVFMDINGFKPVNDTYGHATGDALLVAFAGRVKACVDNKDLFARLAGDEFVLLASGTDDDSLGERLTQRLRTAVQKPFVLDDQPITVGMSIGLAHYPPDGPEIHGLLTIADHRLDAHTQSTGKRRQDYLLA